MISKSHSVVCTKVLWKASHLEELELHTRRTQVETPQGVGKVDFRFASDGLDKEETGLAVEPGGSKAYSMASIVDTLS